jgi:hypothetical protein
MKKMFLFVPLVFCLLFIAGCQESAKKEKLTEPNIVSESDFPPIMVGVWQADINDNTGAQWGIKFEPDGSILKVIHSLAGPVNLAEGGVDIIGPDPNTYGVFIIGPCTANYDKAAQVLKVKIILDYYEMQFPVGKVQGRMEDNFWGEISDDGKTWNVKWVNYTWMEEADPPDVNYINAYPEELVFTKLDIDSLKQEAEQKQDEQPPSQ